MTKIQRWNVPITYGAELWFFSLLDDRPAPLFWPMGEPAENWPLVAVRLLDAGLAVRGENGLTPPRRWPRCWTP